MKQSRPGFVLLSGLIILATVLMVADRAQAGGAAAELTDRPAVPTGLDADAVERLLPASLAEYAEVFCEEESEHGVNLLFVAAIARQETASGTAGVGESRNNLFGNRRPNGYMRFDGFEASIVNKPEKPHREPD